MVHRCARDYRSERARQGTCPSDISPKRIHSAELRFRPRYLCVCRANYIPRVHAPEHPCGVSSRPLRSRSFVHGDGVMKPVSYRAKSRLQVVSRSDEISRPPDHSDV